MQHRIPSNPDKPEPNRWELQYFVISRMQPAGMLEYWKSGILGQQSEPVIFKILLNIVD